MLKLNPPEQPVYTDGDLLKAIEILSAECYGAMSFANALGGEATIPWQILRNNSWTEIVNEAVARGLDVSHLKCAVTGTPVMWSATFLYASGQITDAQRKKRFQAEVKKDGVWANPNP